MAHFAQLDESNKVLQVIVVNNSECGDLPFPESEPVGIAFCKNLFGPNTIWKQTSYNNNFRRYYACVGGSYDPNLDIFVLLQPYPSWIYNTATGEWDSPVPMPTIPEGYMAVWDEIAQEWDIILNKAI